MTAEKLTWNQNVTVNGNITTFYANFPDGTFATMKVRESQGLKKKNYYEISRGGNFDTTKISIQMGSLGQLQVFPISTKTSEVGAKLNHSAFGEVTVLSSNNGCLVIELTDGSKKQVMEKFFMNGVK
jgi:hypothetical protein